MKSFARSWAGDLIYQNYPTSVTRILSQTIDSDWFRASEAMGDFMGIRYGRLTGGVGDAAKNVEWHFVSHCECDGIGGFARLLRERGAVIPELPVTTSPCRRVMGPLWRLVRGSGVKGGCARRADWRPSAAEGARSGPSAAVAWHVFTEAETAAIRARCREPGVTVNSFLLKHLDEAVRPEVRRPDLRVTWMVPVNLRGDVRHADDTANHVSCVEVKIAPDDRAMEIQQQIRRSLERGEHRANQILLGIGRFLGHAAKVKFLTMDRARPAGTIGAFSNLGVWDAEKKIATEDVWVFCPPVVKGQLLGAGCVTFQNRLGLAIQGHGSLSGTPGIAGLWMGRWRTLVEGLPPT